MKNIACAKCKNPIRSCDDHTHSGWEIALQLEGVATAKIGGKEYPLTPGTITVVPPGVVHRNYSDTLYSDMFLKSENLDFIDVIVTKDVDNEILTLMNMLHKTVTEKKEHSALIANRITDLICIYINNLNNTDTRFPFVNKFKDIIYQNLSNSEFEINKEIKKLGFHPDYFRRCFKSVTGTTPLDYLTTLRMNQAKTLLEQNNFISVSTVANNCGFKDSFYFSTCFRKHTGVSPREYKNNLLRFKD